MLRLLLLDNHDSFTWNLAHYLEELGARVDVVLNDAVGARDAAGAGYDAVVLSPGPGRPEEAGVTLELIDALGGRTPLLGVCLGHQAIAVAAGARIVGAPSLVHGKTSPIHHDGSGLFEGLDNPFDATRYHSLVVEERSLPQDLQVNARTVDGAIMGFRHREHPVHGVQFHPESVLTRAGKPLLSRFLELAVRWRRDRTHAA